MYVRMLRCFRVVICVLFLTSILTCHIFAISTCATSAVLIDVDSGRILYAQNENARMRIASTTKILTALVAMEQGDLSAEVCVSRNATLAEGSSMYLQQGERLTLETLLYGLLLCSGNDAAIAVAEAVSGSVAQFVTLMNQRAAELGMEGSSFANPNGLDAENHYSTASDMAKLACAAVRNETLMRIASSKTIAIGGRTMHNHNQLLSTLDGCIGLKTGYTRAAGRTLVSCARRNGQLLAAVTLQDGNDWADHAALYAYGFACFPTQCAMTRGETMCTLSVSGTGETVPLLAAETVNWPVAEGETLDIALETPACLPAPVFAGQTAGEAVITLNGQAVRRVTLVCGSAALVTLAEPMQTFHKLRSALMIP